MISGQKNEPQRRKGREGFFAVKGRNKTAWQRIFLWGSGQDPKNEKNITSRGQSQGHAADHAM